MLNGIALLTGRPETDTWQQYHCGKMLEIINTMREFRKEKMIPWPNRLLLEWEHARMTRKYWEECGDHVKIAAATVDLEEESREIEKGYDELEEFLEERWNSTGIYSA